MYHACRIKPSLLLLLLVLDPQAGSFLFSEKALSNFPAMSNCVDSYGPLWTLPTIWFHLFISSFLSPWSPYIVVLVVCTSTQPCFWWLSNILIIYNWSVCQMLTGKCMMVKPIDVSPWSYTSQKQHTWYSSYHILYVLWHNIPTEKVLWYIDAALWLCFNWLIYCISTVVQCNAFVQY